MSEREDAEQLDLVGLTAVVARGVQSGQRSHEVLEALQSIDTQLRQMLSGMHEPTNSAEAEQATQFGAAWSNIGKAWGGIGFREEALAATQEACRWLGSARSLNSQAAEWYPTGLNNLGAMLSNLGRREEALKATEEAVALYRSLHRARPEAFADDLASSLNNLGNMLSNLGRREEALKATAEAVALYRSLHRARPEAFAHDLATSLNNLGGDLSALGRREEALKATEEAVALYRSLHRDRPEAFANDLAASLNNLGNGLSALGRREAALKATEEAAELRRSLHRARPEAFAHVLATNLNNLGAMLSNLGRREEALKATEEAVELRRSLHHARPDAFASDLATSLNNLGNMLSDLGRREEALTATQEAVELRRRLHRARPEAFAHDLAMSLNNLGARLSELGLREEALKATQEAVELYRSLHRARPEAFADDLASSLNNLGSDLSALGRREEALQATEEAVALRRRLHRARPEAFAQDLAMSLINLGTMLSQAGQWKGALDARAEAGRVIAAAQSPDPNLLSQYLRRALPAVRAPEDLRLVHLRMLPRLIDLRAAESTYGKTGREAFLSLQATLVADLWGKLTGAAELDPGFTDEALPALVAALQSPDLARMLADAARGTPEGDALFEASVQLMQAQGALGALMKRLSSVRPGAGSDDAAADPGSSLRSAEVPAALQDDLDAARQREQAAQAAHQAASAALARANRDFAAAYLPPTTPELHQMLQALRQRSAPLRAAPEAPVALLCMMDIAQDEPRGTKPGEAPPRRLVGMLVHSERGAAIPVTFDGLHDLAQECQRFKIRGERSAATLRDAGEAWPTAATTEAEPPQRSLDEILADVHRLWWQPLAEVLAREGVSLGSLHLSSHGVAHHLPFAAVLDQAVGENTALHQWPGLPHLRAAHANAHAKRQLRAAEVPQDTPQDTPAGHGMGRWQIGHDCAWADPMPLPMVALESHWLQALAAHHGQPVQAVRSLDQLQAGGAAIALCAHGEGNGSQSGVRLGPTPLNAAEVMHRRLAAELVLLPSCLAGHTEDDLGGNAMGLAAGFLFAGSGTVVGSSKKVPDTIMPWFSTLLAWHVLHDKLSPQQAAQRARRELADGSLHNDPKLEPYRSWMKSHLEHALAHLQPGGAEHAGLQDCLLKQRAQAQQKVQEAMAKGEKPKEPELDTLQRLDKNWPWRDGLQPGALTQANPLNRMDDTLTAKELLFTPHGEPAKRDDFAQQMRELATFVVVYGLG